MNKFRSAAYAFLEQHAALIVVLFLGFVLRSYLAPWRPYWYDEFISVYLDGSNHDTVFDAILSLAYSSIHPPLYQFILYNWMDLFGTSELATRSLSNVYVVGATLCLYLFSYKVYGKRVALGSAIIFTVMYFPMRYGLEARSYAQTLFLTCLSSLLLYRYVTKLPRPCSWRGLLNRRLVWLTLANAGLIMTHYYNVFFLGAQGLFLLIYLLTIKPHLSAIAETAKAALISVVPVVLLLFSWGWAMAYRYAQFEERGTYSADFPSADPWTIFSDYVIDPTFGGADLGALAPVAVAAVLILLTIQGVWAVYRYDGRGAEDRGYFTLYVVIWAFVPCVMAFLLFLVAHAERYSARYFIFCAPPLAVMTLLAVENIFLSAKKLLSKIKALDPARHYVRYSLIYAIVVALAIAAPGGRQAASLINEDYRGIAQLVVNTVRGNPSESYVLYEANHTGTLNYYLPKMSKGGVRVEDKIRPSYEKLSAQKFREKIDEIDGHDFLIVAFTHKRLKSYPRTVRRLDELYTRHITQLDRRGRGIIVWDTRK
jgi:uncharacterized membrane protein